LFDLTIQITFLGVGAAISLFLANLFYSPLFCSEALRSDVLACLPDHGGRRSRVRYFPAK